MLHHLSMCTHSFTHTYNHNHNHRECSERQTYYSRHSRRDSRLGDARQEPRLLLLKHSLAHSCSKQQTQSTAQAFKPWAITPPA